MKKGYTIILLCFISVSLYSQSFHWIGPSSGSGGNWTDANNWSLTAHGAAALDWPKDAADDAIFDQDAVVNLNGVGSFPLNSIQVILNKTAKLYTNSALNITVNSSAPGNEGLRVDAGSTLRDSTDGNVNFNIVFGTGSSGELNGDLFLAGNPAIGGTNGASFQTNPGVLTVGNGGRVILRPRSGLINATVGTLTFGAGSLLILDRDGGNGPNATYNPASTLRITGNTNNASKVVSSGVGNVGNVEYDCPGLITAVNMFMTNTNIQGSLKILNTNNQVLTLVTNPTGGAVTTTVAGNFEISGNSIVTLGDAATSSRAMNLQVNGNYIQSGGLLSLQQSDGASATTKLLLKGSFTQTGGTFTASSLAQSTSTNLFVLELNGAVAQTFSSTAATIDNLNHQVALRINNPNGVTLNSPLAVGRVDFASGKIFTSTANALLITNTGNNPIDINGASSSSYVEGPVKRKTAGTTAYLFPVGKGGSYRICEVIPTTAAASEYSAEYFNTAYPDLTRLTPLTGVANDRWWDISKVSGSDAAIRLTLTGAVPGAGPTDALVVAHYNGADWVNAKGATGTGITPGNATSGTALSSSQSSFSPFTFGFGPSGSLPIKLEYFTAEKGVGFNNLHWKANCFSAKAVFELERSTDGRQFNKISTIEADQLRCQQPFDFRDNNAGQATVYYRVRVIDVDGSAFYSRIVAVVGKNTGLEIVGVYPTIVKGNGQLRVNVISGNANNMDFVITNTTGQIVKRLRLNVSPGDNNLTLNLQELANGMYQITGYNSDGEMRTFRFIKQ